MASDLLTRILSDLHRETLKPIGFPKERNTFSRNRGTYTERFNFQAGRGLMYGEGLFYLNVGVEFAEFGPGERDSGYVKGTHWGGRIDQLVPTAPAFWRYTEGVDKTALKAELTKLILAASEQIAIRLDELRAAYQAQVTRRSGNASARE